MKNSNNVANATKAFSISEMYELCNKHQFFTSGSNSQYDKFFDLCKTGVTQNELTIMLYLTSRHTFEEISDIVKDLFVETPIESEETSETATCAWCGEEYECSELDLEEDMGLLCEQCQMAIESRGETLKIIKN